MIKNIIGVDPGMTGAIWALDYDTKKRISHFLIRKKGDEIDIQSLVSYLKQFKIDESISFCENPHPNEKDGIKTVYSAFKYGESVTTLRVVLMMLGIRTFLVNPPQWKTHFALIAPELDYKEKKKMSIEKACYLSPEDKDIFLHTDILNKEPKHDLSEAYLIANYGIYQYERQEMEKKIKEFISFINNSKLVKNDSNKLFQFSMEKRQWIKINDILQKLFKITISDGQLSSIVPLSFSIDGLISIEKELKNKQFN